MKDKDRDMTDRDRWENTIKIVLKEHNPCNECLVQVTCLKSFTNGSACEKLAKALEVTLKDYQDENKT